MCLDAANAKSYPGSGTAWTDLSGRNNNGTLINTPTFSSANGGLINFTAASSHYVSVTDADSLSSATLSVEAWVRFSVAGTRIIYCGKGGGANFADTEYWLERTAGNKFSVWFSNGTTGSNHLLASSSVSTNTWYHVVGVYDGTAIRGYVNGVQDPATFSLTGSLVSTSIIYSIGRLGSLASLYHSGDIAVNRIYNRALSAVEIQQNFNALRGRFGI
jgi:hypothetical protein